MDGDCTAQAAPPRQHGHQLLVKRPSEVSTVPSLVPSLVPRGSRLPSVVVTQATQPVRENCRHVQGFCDTSMVVGAGISLVQEQGHTCVTVGVGISLVREEGDTCGGMRRGRHQPGMTKNVTRVVVCVGAGITLVRQRM